MEVEPLGFWARLWMFFCLPWKVLFNAPAAGRVRLALSAEAPAALEPPAGTGAEEETPADGAASLHLLAILQRDGRLVDFLQEDIASATDEQVGAAARVVHEGCRKALSQYLTLAPVRAEGEGDPVVVPAGFDPSAVRLTGNVTGQPPFRGRLAHAGWRAVENRLPKGPAGRDPALIAPAEVELP